MGRLIDADAVTKMLDAKLSEANNKLAQERDTRRFALFPLRIAKLEREIEVLETIKMDLNTIVTVHPIHQIKGH